MVLLDCKSIEDEELANGDCQPDFWFEQAGDGNAKRVGSA
jgi:hypothetical protein